MRITYFAIFVAELALDAQTQRRAMFDGEWRAVEVVGENCLRMEGVDEVVSFVVTAGSVERLFEFVGAVEGNVARLGL